MAIGKAGARGGTGSLGVLGIPSSPYAPQTQAALARMSPQPSAATALKLDTMIRGLVSTGVWAKLDVLCVALDTQAQSLTNLIQNAFNATVAGTPTPTFVANSGFTTDGTQNYIDLGIGVQASGQNLVQDSSSFGIWSLTSGQVSGNSAAGWGSGNGINIRTRNTSDQMQIRINVNSGGLITVSNTDGSGLLAANRSDSSNCQLYKNGTVRGTTSVASGLITGNLCVGRVSGALLAAVGVSAWFAGSTLTAQNHADLYDKLNSFFLT